MGKVVELDVREDLQKKLEPFQKIMNAVQQLEAGDTFFIARFISISYAV